MSGDLVKRLKESRDQCSDCNMFETASDLNDAIIALETANARIAALEAQIATVAPAVDAQPVAWIDEYALRSLESNATAVCAPIGMRDENQTIPLYTSAQSEGLRKDAERYRHLRQCNSGSLVIVQIIGTGEDDQIVLTEEHADEAIDTALSQHTGEKDD